MKIAKKHVVQCVYCHKLLEFTEPEEGTGNCVKCGKVGWLSEGSHGAWRMIDDPRLNKPK